MNSNSNTNVEMPPPQPQRKIGQQYTQLIAEIEELTGAWRNLKSNIDPVLGPDSGVKAMEDGSKKNPQSTVSPLAADIRTARYLLRDLKLDMKEALDRMEL